MNSRVKHSAQSLIEFAIMLPLLFMLVMGLFDIGRAIFYYAIINTAVREGTRFAIVQPACDYMANPDACTGGYPDTYPIDCSSVVSTANNNICSEITTKYLLIGDLVDSIITIDHLINDSDDPVINIRIEFPFSPITPGMGLIGDISLQADSQMLMAPIAKP